VRKKSSGLRYCSLKAGETNLQQGDIRVFSLDDERIPALADLPATERAEEAIASQHLRDSILLAPLDNEEKVAVRMRLEDARLQDIAETLGKSVATAQRRVIAGFTKLCQYLHEE
jgi:DNA-directed RNA polymerase specialized sigma24 family protein